MEPLGEFKDPIVDGRSFDETLAWIKRRAVEVLEEKGEFPHLLIYILPDGSVSFAVFDAVVGEAMSLYNDLNLAKEAAFRSLATLAKRQKAVGYFDVAEAWHMRTLGGAEAALSAYRNVLDRHGSLENMLTRDEVLYVTSNWRGNRQFTSWKITRGPGGVFCGPPQDMFPAGEDRTTLLDLAIGREDHQSKHW
jgi:hypothetical protein